MPFFYENENLFNTIMGDLSPRESLYFNQDIFVSSKLKDNGGCAGYGLGVHAPDAIEQIKQLVNRDPILKNMVIQDMLESFWDKSGRINGYKRFNFDEKKLQYRIQESI